MSSTLFTIGTALSRARDHDLPVRVLVAGHWIEGHVSEIDSQGVVLSADDAQHVARVQDVAAVTVLKRSDTSRHEAAEHAEWLDEEEEPAPGHPAAPTVRVLPARRT